MSAPTQIRSLLGICAVCVTTSAVCTWLVVRHLRNNRTILHKHIAATRSYERAVTDLASISRQTISLAKLDQPDRAASQL